MRTANSLQYFKLNKCFTSRNYATLSKKLKLTDFLLMFSSPPFPGQVIQSGDETKQIVCKLVVASGLLAGPL